MARPIVISGPSGVGKGTLIEYVRSQLPEMGLSISATTRAPREGEVDGESYHFVSRDTFEEALANNRLIEYNFYNNQYYGTFFDEVERFLSEGRSVILDIDVHGAKNLKAAYPDAYLIFVLPPSTEELERRLRARGSESDEQVRGRLEQAQWEMQQTPLYDAVIVNDDLEVAEQQILHVITAALEGANTPGNTQ